MASVDIDQDNLSTDPARWVNGVPAERVATYFKWIVPIRGDAKANVVIYELVPITGATVIRTEVGRRNGCATGPTYTPSSVTTYSGTLLGTYPFEINATPETGGSGETVTSRLRIVGY